MKKKEFIKIARELLPHFPQLTADRMLIFKSPMGDILSGLSFGGSVDPNVFYVCRFLLPLYVPTEHVHITFGERLRVHGNQGWRSDDPHLIENLTDTIQREIPFIENVSTLKGALDHLKKKVEDSGARVNSHVLEAYAYTTIKIGDYSSALKSLVELRKMLEGDTIPWVVAQCDRAHLIEEKLLQNTETALAQLEVWKAETIANLGLEKHVV